jgi:hypothetical protein
LIDRPRPRFNTSATRVRVPRMPPGPCGRGLAAPCGT